MQKFYMKSGGIREGGSEGSYKTRNYSNSYSLPMLKEVRVKYADAKYEAPTYTQRAILIPSVFSIITIHSSRQWLSQRVSLVSPLLQRSKTVAGAPINHGSVHLMTPNCEGGFHRRESKGSRRGAYVAL